MPSGNRACCLLIAALLSTSACGAPAPRQASTAEAPSRGFVNRVWSVRESTAVAAGTLYVFLSDGTLIVASEHGKPMLGTWQARGDGLVMMEESIAYDVDIVELSADELTLRSHNPGEPVVTTLTPAPVPRWPQ